MDIQRVNWKLNFADPAAAKPADFFKVFNTWIPNSPEIFIDVADYEHVKDGPLTILVGHYADYSLDHTDRKLGLAYNGKRLMEGKPAERLQSSLASYIQNCIRLVEDPVFNGKLKLKTNEFVFLINDRASAPNTKASFEAVKPELEALFAKVYGKGNFTLAWRDAPKQRFSVVVTGKSEPELKQVLKSLN